MGVRLKQSNTFKTTVDFFVSTAGGKAEAWSFVAEFKRISTEEVKAIVEDKNTNDIEKLKLVLVGWRMEDIDTKDQIPFTPENLDEFCGIPKAAGNTMLRFIETVGTCREKP